jgi:dTDP-4-amino-4,6-dideoxygalactose transaminase
MVKFVEPAGIDIEAYVAQLEQSVDSNHYTNFGPSEKELSTYLANKADARVVMFANATIALQALHDFAIFNGIKKVSLPAFTFPATIQTCPLVKYDGVWTAVDCDSFGQAVHNAYDRFYYAITTMPFGNAWIVNQSRPSGAAFWFIDNAAGIDPDLAKVDGCLEAGADAVVVSLHATKILNAAEGGFIATRNDQLFNFLRRYINFGFSDSSFIRTANLWGTNGKMSELSASLALSQIKSGVFKKDFDKRCELNEKYYEMCEDLGLNYILSEQAFWIESPATIPAIDFCRYMSFLQVDCRPYYQDYLGLCSSLPVAKRYSTHGVCLPTNSTALEKFNQIEEAVKKCIKI